MGSSQTSGPILVPLNVRCRNLIHNQKGPKILRTTRVFNFQGFGQEGMTQVILCDREEKVRRFRG